MGVRIIHGKGQVFWNSFRNNGVGLEVRGTVQHNLNNNDFFDNDVGLFWGLAATPHPQTGAIESRLTEFDHNDFDLCRGRGRRVSDRDDPRGTALIVLHR